jgi:PAS domain S-box-containing protein
MKINTMEKHSFLEDGGEMGELIRSVDWSVTPVGVIDYWPQSLRTAIGIMLEAQFPMYIAWGSSFTQFYNDEYRALLGPSKHPKALGISARETFADVWGMMEPMLQDVLSGKALIRKDVMLPLDRFGYIEECYFIFSYSPIRDETGRVGGIMIAATETTDHVIGERRLKTLTNIANMASEAESTKNAIDVVFRAIGDNLYDISFALYYQISEEGDKAFLRGTVGLRGHRVSKHHVIDLKKEDDLWPLYKVVESGKPELVIDIQKPFNDLPGGGWAEHSGTVYMVPICFPDKESPYAVFVFGVSPRKLFDENYKTFFKLFAGYVTALIATGLANEAYKRRHEAVFGPVDISTLTTALANSFRSAIEKAGIVFTIHCPPISEMVYLDHSMWEKIVLNLLSNAYKFTMKGEIVISLKKKNGFIELTVSDTGIGIRENELPKLFERFYRGYPSEGFDNEATSIGLSLIRELVRLHGGAISANSSYGRGSTFSVSIPLGNSHLPVDKISLIPYKSTISSSAESYVSELLQWQPAKRNISKRESVEKEHPDGLLADERKRLLEALREGEHRYRQLIQSLPIAFYIYDPEGRITLYNEAAANLWGREPDTTKELWSGAWKLYSPDGKLISPEQSPMAMAIREGNPLQDEEIIIERPDGVKLNVLAYPKPIFDTTGKIIEAVSMLIDITRHKRVEQALRESEARFHKLADSAPVLIWLSGTDKRFTYFNKTWLSFTGRLLEQEIGNGWIEGVHPEDVDRCRAVYQNYFDGRKEFQMEYRLRRFDGEYRWMLDYGIPLFSPDNQFTGYIGSCTDITGRIELEKHKDELIGIASHELKTPVTSIKAYTQFLLSGFKLKGDEESVALLTKMEFQIDKLTQLIYDFLDVTKIQAGNFKLNFTIFNIKQMIEETVSFLQTTTKKHTLMKDIQIPEKIHGDRVRIAQILENFITNAIKYSPNPSSILIKAEVIDNNKIEISVKDQGMGIPATMKDKVFERFFRIDHKDSMTYPGVGLGLYLSREIMRLHGGSIGVDSEEGKGSTFYFSFPLKQFQT